MPSHFLRAFSMAFTITPNLSLLSTKPPPFFLE
uniref:Uncharacterized protein n=1 Tax=Anguilla anguilla TaxID=7936 RepID=A0A0E9XRZ8_ANGAN